MTDKEYETICELILNTVMKSININKMKHFDLNRQMIQSQYGIVYDSAATSTYPMSLIYTPPGTGKSNLVKDRIKLLQHIGIPSQKILVLNMNITTTNQIQNEFPDATVRTFSEFMHDIISANLNVKLADLASIANMISLEYSSDPIADEFTKKLIIDDPKECTTLLTLFINKHIHDIIKLINNIGYSDYSLDAMICQNMIYKFKNPYPIDAIIINGVQNMPIPALASTIEYADRFQCNLFITGDPKEAIYDFNMAYGNTMNLISAYKQQGIDIIHLNNVPCMNQSIKNIAEMQPNGKINKNDVNVANVATNYDTPVNEILEIVLGPNAPYLYDKIRNKQPVLIISRSKNDIKAIHKALKKVYIDNSIPLNIIDLTKTQQYNTIYGTLATEYINDLNKYYPKGISIRLLFSEIYNILQYKIQNMEKWSFKKAKYKQNLDCIEQFYNQHKSEFGDTDQSWPVKDCIKKLIQIETNITQQQITDSQSIQMNKISKADIILSTVHSVTDIHMDNVVVVLKQMTDQIDTPLTYVALSRAMKSEYIIFINYGDFKTPYQAYIESHLADTKK